MSKNAKPSKALKEVLHREVNLNAITDLDEDVIITTKIKLGRRLENLLKKHRPPEDRWNRTYIYLGILLPLVTTLMTANFHDFPPFKGDTLKHLFIFSSLCCAPLLVRSVWHAVTTKRSSDEDEVRQFLSTIAGNDTDFGGELRGESNRNGKRPPRSRRSRSSSRAAFKNRIRSFIGNK